MKKKIETDTPKTLFEDYEINNSDYEKKVFKNKITNSILKYGLIETLNKFNLIVNHTSKEKLEVILPKNKNYFLIGNHVFQNIKDDFKKLNEIELRIFTLMLEQFQFVIKNKIFNNNNLKNDNIVTNDEFTSFHVDLSKLSINNQDYIATRQNFTNLQQISIKIPENIIDDSGRSYHYALIAKFSWYDYDHKPEVKVTIAKKLFEILTYIHFDNQKKYHTKYFSFIGDILKYLNPTATHLYLYLSKNKGFRNSEDESMSQGLKINYNKLLEILHLSPKTEFRNFKSNYLNNAHKIINNCTDIYFNYKFDKIKNVVSFFIYEQEFISFNHDNIIKEIGLDHYRFSKEQTEFILNATCFLTISHYKLLITSTIFENNINLIKLKNNDTDELNLFYMHLVNSIQKEELVIKNKIIERFRVAIQVEN